METIRRRRKKKEKARTGFIRDPFKHAQQWLDEKWSMKPDTTKEEPENFI